MWNLNNFSSHIGGTHLHHIAGIWTRLDNNHIKINSTWTLHTNTPYKSVAIWIFLRAHHPGKSFNSGNLLSLTTTLAESAQCWFAIQFLNLLMGSSTESRSL